MKRTGILLFVWLIFFSVKAQTDFDHYQHLVCSGPVPADFTTHSTEKYLESKNQISKNLQHQDKKTQEEFYLESNFAFDNLLLSGKVLFGDPVTIYLNKIKDELLKDNGSLKDSIRIYTYRSDEANAFTANSGVVIVTTGLIAQAETESELAFILSHEFIHYIKKHGLKIFAEGKKIEKGEGVYHKLDVNDLELSAFQYSQDMESEADREGLKLYEKSNYSLKAIENVFNVLLYSYLPFDEVKFEKSFFENEGYVFPQKYFLDSLKEITAQEDYDDSHSSHPNIKKRKSALLALVDGVGNDGRKDYIVSESDFRNVQKICRYEQCLLQLNTLHYEDAIYSAYILLQRDTGSFFLHKIIAQGLYGLNYYKTFDLSRNDYEGYREKEGNQQQLYYLLHKMDAKELNVLAIHYAYPLLLKHPDDPSLKEIGDRLLYDLTDINKLAPEDFMKSYPQKTSVKDTVQVKDNTDNAGGAFATKYDKIKKKKEEKINAGEVEYYKLAFVELFKQDSFVNAFKGAEDYARNQDTDPKAKAKKNDEKKLISKKGYALGIDSALIVNPVYLKVDETSKEPVEYIASEDAQLNLSRQLDDNARKLNLHLDFLESKKLNTDDADKFNDLAALNDYLDEYRTNEFNDMLNSHYEDMQKIAAKYHTANITWFGVVSRKGKNEMSPITWCYSVYIIPIPFIIYYAMRPSNHTYFFTMVVDAKTGKLKMKYLNVVNQNDLASVQTSNIYYILQQIKSKRKSK